MSIRAVNAISGRLSLRPPQRTSLEILDRVCEIVKPSKQTDLKIALEIIRSEYPTVTDFERDFPSLCFALATGVGKTRLMGAFIAYLHQEHELSDFFVLAPNLTIYNKLIADFTPNTPKYVFKGLGEFATEGVEIITGEETVAELLSVESRDNKTEIVVHVNMLKEGWDVTNLFTIVPLRKADSRTLVEQSIGRGLRLPYGQRTGVPAVDRLTIVAHDKFQEIIDEANKPGSSIHFKMAQVIVGKDIGVERKVTKFVAPTLFADIDRTEPSPKGKPGGEATTLRTFADESERKLAHATITAIRELERDTKRVPTMNALKSPVIQAELARKVAASMAPKQKELTGLSEPPDIAAVVAKATELFAQRTIGIPRIIVVPRGEVTSGFHDFDMDLKATRPLPVDHAILIQNLRNDERFVIDEHGLPETEERLENYLVGRLIDHDDICYDEQADLLYKLAGQVINHLRSYLSEDDKVLNVLLYNLPMWVELIHAQMQKHRWTKAAGYDVSASRGFESLKDVPFTAIDKHAARDLREPPEPLHDIPKMLFTGFSRCLYPIQKFGSDPERRFAILLEDEKKDLKWFKPVRDQFRIYYRGDQTYEPDFVVETDTDKLLCEPKRSSDMHDEDVQAKAKASIEWCRHATDHELVNGGKPWCYALIPHDAITASANLAGLVAKYKGRTE